MSANSGRVMIGARKIVGSLVLAGTLASGAAAAQLAGRKPPALDSEANRSRELDSLKPDRRPPNRGERLAAKRRELFKKRLSEFAKAWNTLMQSSAKGGWNARQAKAVRIAFDRLVHCDGWAEMAATDDSKRQSPQTAVSVQGR